MLGAAHPSCCLGRVGTGLSWSSGRWQWECEGCCVQEERWILCPFVPDRLTCGAVPAAGWAGRRWLAGPRCCCGSGSVRRPCLRCRVPCREKLVQVAVELLSTEVAEKALVAVTLRLLAVLLARYEWRVPFATEGGVRAVLGCMQQHGCSALVQQAGLAVSAGAVGGLGCPGVAEEPLPCAPLWSPQALKVLVGAADGEPGGAGGKCLPWNHGDAQMLREIFASIGSASSEGSASLLSSIPAALSTMQRVPG